MSETPTAARGVDIALAHPDNLFNRLSLPPAPSPSLVQPPMGHVPVKKLGKGNHEGKRVPFAEKLLIGVTSRIDGTSAAARAFGVGVSTADGYKDGSNQQGKKDAKPEPNLKKALDATIGKVRETVTDKLLRAVDGIQDDKIDDLGKEPLKAAVFASTMATVYDKLSPKQEGGDHRVQIMVYAPEERDEVLYERKEVPLTVEER